MENTLQLLDDASLDQVTGGFISITGFAGVGKAVQIANTYHSGWNSTGGQNVIENTGVSITTVLL